MIKNKYLKYLIYFFRHIAVILTITIMWEIFSRKGIINCEILSSPSKIAVSFYELLKSETLFKDIISSLKRVFVGVSIGFIVGLVCGIVLGISKRVYEYLGAIIEILRPIPPIAWIPIAILWFGIGDYPAYFLVSIGAFFPVYTSIMNAIRNIEKQYINVAKSFGAKPMYIIRKVIIPQILPNILSSLKVGLGIGWIIVITAEMAGAQDGLGYMIQLNRIMLQSSNVIVGMITIGLIGLMFSILFKPLENLMVPWMRRMRTVDK